MTPDSPLASARKRSSPLIGEEAVAVPTSPAKNLVAAAFVAAVSVVAIALAARMPNPGDLSSHPGLLPMLTGVSLLAMALALGVRAIRDGALAALGTGSAGGLTIDVESRRTLLLIGIIIAYVVLLDWLSFEVGMAIGNIDLRIGSFECISIPALALILGIFWRAPPLRCLVVAACVVLAIAGIFRYGFAILLPGS